MPCFLTLIQKQEAQGKTRFPLFKQDGNRNLALDDPTWGTNFNFCHLWQSCNRCSGPQNVEMTERLIVVHVDFEQNFHFTYYKMAENKNRAHALSSEKVLKTYQVK